MRSLPATTRRALLFCLAGAALIALGVSLWPWGASRHEAEVEGPAQAAARPVPVLTTPPVGVSLPEYRPLAAARLAELPEAAYDRVIPGLIPVTSGAVGVAQIGSLRSAAPLFDASAATPVARMQATGPFGDANPIVVIATVDGWGLVLTPARQSRPSDSATGSAPAQTAGWMPARYITGLAPAATQIVVNTTSRTLTIKHEGKADEVFPAGVGKASTPTPVGVTGYLEARFADAGSGTRATRIQLTSLHTPTKDDPAGGGSGGLVALHWWPTTKGAVSHGCIRVRAAALAAIDALPLGTPVTIIE